MLGVKKVDIGCGRVYLIRGGKQMERRMERIYPVYYNYPPKIFLVNPYDRFMSQTGFYPDRYNIFIDYANAETLKYQRKEDRKKNTENPTML